MGYHIVDVTLRNGEQVRNIVVYNAEEMEWPAQQGRIASLAISWIYRKSEN